MFFTAPSRTVEHLLIYFPLFLEIWRTIKRAFGMKAHPLPCPLYGRIDAETGLADRIGFFGTLWLWWFARIFGGRGTLEF